MRGQRPHEYGMHDDESIPPASLPALPLHPHTLHNAFVVFGHCRLVYRGCLSATPSPSVVLYRRGILTNDVTTLELALKAGIRFRGEQGLGSEEQWLLVRVDRLCNAWA